MGTIWVQEFTGGLDSRRLPETTVGGVLIVAKDGHITRGGEFEQRAAFVPVYDLPAGTTGLAVGLTGLVTFGSGPRPAGLPAAVGYQQLVNDEAPLLARVLSYDLYAGKLYVVAEFADGSRKHFYDGARVTDWYDGRGRGAFAITSGGTTQAKSATAYADVVGGSAGAANAITAITVAGIGIIGAAVAHTGDNATTAAAVAAAINSFTSNPDYTATAAGVRVTVKAATPGAGVNGQTVSVTTQGDFQVGNGVPFSGGVDGATGYVEDVTVNGVSVLNARVAYQGSLEATAAAVAQGITAKVSNPDYSGSATDATVNIVSNTADAAQNGYPIVVTTSGGLTVDKPTGATISGASSSQQLRVPGDFVRTIGTKMYSVSGPNLHFSGVAQPTKWTTDTAGAGFIDFSAQASGLEHLYAVAEYQQYIAIFAERVTKIQYVDPDPTLSKAAQTLRNTGTASPRSVTQFGDNDIFYLDESGVRSLRARDASNAASTSDVGVPVDSLVTAKLASLAPNERRSVIGLIEPTNGRYWLCMKDRIFVFSFFSGAKVSAWSQYEPGFTIDDAGVFARRVYLRSGDKIYVYGGQGTDVVYDETVAEAWLPYLDAGKPTTPKLIEGVDAAVLGKWSIALGMEPTNLEAEVSVATITETTFNRARLTANGRSTHFQLRFRSMGLGPHKLAAAVIQFSGGAPDAKT